MTLPQTLKAVAGDLLILLPLFFMASHLIVWYELGFRIIG